MGPWTHGGQLEPGGGAALGPINFGAVTADYFREQILAAWLADRLKGDGHGAFPRAMLFETGANRWVELREGWEAERTTERSLYLQPDGVLSFSASRAGQASTSYTSDPASPVPYRPLPIEPMFGGRGWATWMTLDQSFASERPDVATWVSEPLTENLVLSGEVMAHLFASTSGSDSDWVVKLIDVYPEGEEDAALRGFQSLVSGEILRGRYRDSFTQPTAVTPGHVEQYRISLHRRRHVFKAGHRIMVQVQSTWFPLYDRNPQTFVSNIFEARDEDFRAAVQTIFHDRQRPSRLVLETVRD
jgi:putative CocE/NonD family hydrolase